MLKKILLISFLLIPICFLHADQNKKLDNVPLATFAGGNFWYTQYEFDRQIGVMYSRVGYTGGVTIYPTYEEIEKGDTKHVEAVQVVYSPSVISYDQLLDIYFESIDPLDQEGQFCHKGPQYQAKIFYHTEQQQLAAEKKLNYMKIKFKGKPVNVQILPFTVFYEAESDYQYYYKRRPFFYKFMEVWCGRPKILKERWG